MASMAKFLQKLKEEDDKDVVYSKKPDEATKLIPPIEEEPTYKKELKEFKISLGSKEETKEKPKKVEEKEKEKPQEKPKEKLKVNPALELFNKSGTEEKFKNKWLETYEKAKSSRKTNSVAQSLKAGNFFITDQGTFIKPSYNTHNKTSDDMLKERWVW